MTFICSIRKNHDGHKKNMLRKIPIASDTISVIKKYKINATQYNYYLTPTKTGADWREIIHKAAPKSNLMILY